jgi:Right handed beta helix region
MHSLSRTKRRFVSYLGAMSLLAAGVLSFTWFPDPIAAMQAGAPREAARMPDGTEFPSWEKPLTFSKTYYVDGNSPSADDAGPGTKERPFRTIGKAADVLEAGERVVIAEGIYREVVRPPRGGTGPDRMISYEAAEGAKVLVRGSAVVKDGWRQSQAFGGRGGVAQAQAGLAGGGGGRAQTGRGGGGQAQTWDVDLDGNWFGGYNPFGMVNMPQQRWQYMNRMSINVHNILVPYTRVRGMMFVDGKPLDQVRVASEFFGRDPSWIGNRGQPYSAELFGELGGGLGKYTVDQNGLSLRVRLPNDDSPDKHLIEATTKAQVFAPARGLGYIRVKGITFEHAGNNFPFPQTGMVSTNGGHHWIIEGNTFQWANSICLSVGGGGGGGLAGGGGTTSHIIRGNTMRYCGLCGLSGQGTSNLLVEDNLFEWIGWQDAEHMSESAGIKFHNARNLLLRNNVIRHMRHASGIWLDVGNVNCRLTRNVFTDILTAHAGIWIEASHEQDQVDNNIIFGIKEAERITPPEVETGGGSGFYILGTDKLIVANNLIGNCTRTGVHFRTEEIRIIGSRGGLSRENKVYNNIFYNTGDSSINFENEHNEADGNVYAGPRTGYLRILTPGRPELLDIQAGRDYHGWEKNGRTGSMQATLDPDKLVLTLSVNGDIPKTKTFNGVSITSDFFGTRTGDPRLPGAFADLSQPFKARSIDPRNVR